jgi:hypothetical protein
VRANYGLKETRLGQLLVQACSVFSDDAKNVKNWKGAENKDRAGRFAEVAEQVQCMPARLGRLSSFRFSFEAFDYWPFTCAGRKRSLLHYRQL